MGIFGGGSNLPPGCSINDIPGNRPEDLYADAVAEEMDSLVEAIEKREPLIEEVRMLKVICIVALNQHRYATNVEINWAMEGPEMEIGLLKEKIEFLKDEIDDLKDKLKKEKKQ